MKTLLTSLFLGLLVCTVNAQWQAAADVSATNGQTLIVKDNVVYLGTDGHGMWKSANNGQSWTQCSNGLTDPGDYSITDLAIMGDILVASSYESGVFISDDEGANWEDITGTLPATITYPATAVACNDTLIIANADYDGVYYTTDSGSTWVQMYSSSESVSDILLIDTNVYVCTQDGVITCSLNNFDRSNISNGLSDSSSQCIITHNDTLFLGTSYAGIYYSDDEGANWQSMNTTSTEALSVNGIAVTNEMFYMATNTGVYKTLKNPINWSLLETGITTKYPNDLIVSDYRIIAATGYEGVYYYESVIQPFLSSSTVESDIQLYPNPASTQLIIESNEYVNRFEILSSDGRVIRSSEFLNDKLITVDLNDLKSGVYFIKLYQSNKVIVKNICKR